MSVQRWRVPGPVITFLLVALILSIGIPSLGETAGFVGLFVGTSVAGLLVLRRSRKLDPPERRAWRLYGIAAILVGVGVASVAVWELTLGNPPAFGPFDLFFLTGYLLLVVALVRLARIDSAGAHWVTTLLDALVGGIALSALVWNAFLHELVDGSMAPGWETAVGLSYPAFDIAIVVGMMIMVIRRSHYHLDLRLLFISAGLSIQVLQDFIYFSRGIGRSFAEAQPVWPLLLLVAIFLVLSGAVVDIVPARREFPERGTPVWAVMWPYLLAGALLATHVVRYRTVVIDADDVLLLDALILIGVVIFLRQVYEIHRNRQKIEAQRSELVASVSHELRTPLTAIVGYLTLLDDAADEEFPEEAMRQMISEATAEARHMSRLVNDLVMLARGNSSAFPLQITEVPVSNVIAAAVRNVEARSARIDERVGDARVRVDADRLQQALTNLLTNAVRYGGDHVILQTHVEDDDLMIEVHDNGTGVPTRFESLIWQQFERGAHRLDAATPGLGIGLAIVRAVAESHGGTAHYRASERLEGACFAFTIPGCVVGAPVEHREVSFSR